MNCSFRERALSKAATVAMNNRISDARSRTIAAEISRWTCYHRG